MSGRPSLLPRIVAFILIALLLVLTLRRTNTNELLADLFLVIGLLTAFFAVALIAGVRSVQRIILGNHRRRRGLCPSCAYSREGLSQSALCPECGAQP
jgi:hypothetical protein